MVLVDHFKKKNETIKSHGNSWFHKTTWGQISAEASSSINMPIIL